MKPNIDTMQHRYYYDYQIRTDRRRGRNISDVRQDGFSSSTITITDTGPPTSPKWGSGTQAYRGIRCAGRRIRKNIFPASHARSSRHLRNGPLSTCLARRRSRNKAPPMPAVHDRESFSTHLVYRVLVGHPLCVHLVFQSS